MEEKSSTLEKMATPKESKWSLFFEAAQFLIVSFVLVFGLRTFVAQPFIVSGDSMDPTFQDGEYLIIDELSYYFRAPERGEIVVFRYPYDPSKFFIKRIIGLPGETVVINSGTVRVKKNENDAGFILEEPYIEGGTNKNISQLLASNEYFVLGDNREQSSDSRVWGPVKEKLITGRVLLRLFPVVHAGLLPGDERTLLKTQIQ